MKLNNHDNAILDDIDLEIIDILGKDSSIPFVEIAKKIGISDATVHLRVKSRRENNSEVYVRCK